MSKILRRIVVLSLSAVFCLSLEAAHAQDQHTAEAHGTAHLRMVIILSRHGVRSPTWSQSQLNSYSALPWPDWHVPPGELTAHGYKLIQIFGSYDHARLAAFGLLANRGCGDAAHTYIWADTNERTVETSRAFSQGAFPDCSMAIHSLPVGAADTLFHWPREDQKQSHEIQSGLQTSDTDQQLITEMQHVLMGCNPTGNCFSAKRPSIMLLGPTVARPEARQRGSSTHDPFAASASFAEDFLLEYAEDMAMTQIGWGHVDESQLRRFLPLHTRYFAIAHRSPTIARVEGSNMLFHIGRTLEQRIDGRTMPAAIGPPDGKLVFIAGHDTNIAAVAALLGLHWDLDGRADDTPPGTELSFELWQNERNTYSVRVVISMQTLHQLRAGEGLTLTSPPAMKVIAIPGCGVKGHSCSWKMFQSAINSAVDPRFVSASSID